MIFLLLSFTLAGFFLGILTGLTPGLHVNTIALILLPFMSVVNPCLLAVAIISMAISHTFFDFFPSVLLGAPEPGTALSVLPGHRLLLKGRGLEAIYLTVIGGVGAIFLTILLFPVLIFILPIFYQNIKNYIYFVLILIAISIVLGERGMKRLYAILVFSLAGFLGFMMLNSYLLPKQFLFFPLFTGLFGLGNLLLSLNKKTKIPKQRLWVSKIKIGASLGGIVKGLFSGILVGTLPGVGASQAATLTQQITRKNNQKEFLISLGAINTIVALFSLISLYTIAKARSGAAVAIQQILEFGFNELVLLLGVALISTGLSAFIILKIMRKTMGAMQKINYQKLTMSIIIFLIVLVTITTGPIGLFVLFVSTSIGLLAPLFGIRRTNLMAVLILPLILFYMGI